MSISTRLGDEGTTDIRCGKRLPKDHPRIECLGVLDELNAFVGDARCAVVQERSGGILERVQRELGIIAGILALPASAETGAEGAAGPGPEVDEAWIDDWIRVLEEEVPFRDFVLPGSNPVSAKLDIARTVCRRVERRLITLDRLDGAPAAVRRYLNRLSDLLFLLARVE
jgi:cob(I)alamin adenosyltransferase